MGVAVIYLVYKTIIVLFNNKKAGYIGALITAIYPTLNLYSAILLRESVVIFFFALSFLFFSLWIKKGDLKNIILSVIFVFISSMFHGGLFLAGLVHLFLFCFYQPEKKRWRLFSKQLMIGVLVTIIYSTLFFGSFASKIPFFTDVTPERMEEATESRATGRTVYLEEMETNSFFDTVWQTPVRTIYFYFTPFPWDVDSYEDVGGLINSLFYLVLFTFFIKTLFYLWREDKALFWALLLILLAFSGAFAWGTSNYGTAFRHKTKILFLIVVVASYSMSLINWKKIRRLAS
jgi:4-amino-4-deoxy-L-arabinose transferase-like glycosyltransferase